MRLCAAFLLLAVLGFAGCEETPAPPPDGPVVTQTHPSERAPDPDVDSDNLLNMAYGASVVSRTAELNLENSAAHAIDGIAVTSWRSAPGSTRETFVFSLPALAAVTRVGATTPQGEEVPQALRFESSLDGKTWRNVTTVELQDTAAPQLATVPRFEARYLRVHTSAPAGKLYVRVRSFHAIGQELARPEPRAIAGCWTINGSPARFEQTGARVTGVIETDPPTYIDGGSDGRVAMVMWTQGPMWGHAAITLTPDGKHLTAIKFHEEPDSHLVGEGWFGVSCGAPASSRPVRRLPAGTSAYPAYGLAFDANDRLIVELSASTLDAIAAMRPTRIVAYELRDDTPEKNRTHAQRRIDSLRAALLARGVDVRSIQFQAAGSDWNGPPISSALQRLMASRVDIIRAP